MAVVSTSIIFNSCTKEELPTNPDAGLVKTVMITDFPENTQWNISYTNEFGTYNEIIHTGNTFEVSVDYTNLGLWQDMTIETRQGQLPISDGSVKTITLQGYVDGELRNEKTEQIQIPIGDEIYYINNIYVEIN